MILLTILLRHATIEACLGELRRNAALRQLIGIDGEVGVPKKWNMSRFLTVLGQEPHLGLLHQVFDAMVKLLGEVVQDLGSHTAGDSSGLSCRPEAGKNKDGLPEPAGGKKEYTDESGAVVKVHEWFGYKFHLLVDVKHEVALAYRVSSTKRGDNEELPALVKQAQENLPKGRMQTLAYDKAADDNETHETLQQARIKAVIENRSLWKEDFERMLPGHDGSSNVVYDESGTVYCYDKVTNPPVRHRMAYIGGEPTRGTLKYRCPAVHEGWACPSHDRCNEGLSYGKSVRVNARSICGGSHPYRVRPSSSNDCTGAAPPSSASMAGSRCSGAPTTATSPAPPDSTPSLAWSWSCTPASLRSLPPRQDAKARLEK